MELVSEATTVSSSRVERWITGAANCFCGALAIASNRLKLTAIFRRYGLPDRMLTDNGAPWGSDAVHRYTWLTVWLLELGVAVSHGRPYHPQTQGKSLPRRRPGTSGFIAR